MWPLMALAGTYPSPTFQNLTVLGTFTASGNVGLPSLAAQAANTVVANVTASSASPTAVALPSCSATGSALGYTSGTGFTCFTGYAPLASPTFTGTPAAPTATTNTNTTQIATTAFVEGEFANPPSGGFGSTTRRPVLATTISANSTITPSSTAGIVGTATNDNANAGSIGEFLSSTILVGSAVSLTNGVNANVTSLSLTAGDWDVWGSVSFNPGGTTVTNYVYGWISTVSATNPTPPQSGMTTVSTSGAAFSLAIPPQRFSIASTTTVYLEAQSGFSTSTQAAYGFIFARRRR
ncbi:hypothetical protein NA66_1001694 [Burkholderia pyrrocinia]|uniref:Phage tail protein n=1 Tax=Burkholderia pyrrocinia TaxID=60550 RepID=A0A318J115_BURPY|nr:hypothetical protein NA66_1001694 [Burkholderia pyrrocinia]SFW58097.1 hypothetical protein SAMN03159384_03011 [Burkholderia sp. NFACC33-1]SFY11185.1 hypothetical protein SAMN03159408_03223 [Burkholderia sp. NFPP32]